MESVKLPLPFLDRYPHELSGGQQRRVGLARTLTLNPSLVILDEPTSGLDVSVQAAVINLFKEMKETFDLTYIFISHDLSVVRILCDRIAVMYAGEIVELGVVEEVFNSPQHPYTQALLNAVPRIGCRSQSMDEEPLAETLANENGKESGCNFRYRCPLRQAVCDTIVPTLISGENGRMVSCHAINPAS
jgi:oligopeptide/dipeptide ABC transporter ATP-binding protein